MSGAECTSAVSRYLSIAGMATVDELVQGIGGPAQGVTAPLVRASLKKLGAHARKLGGWSRPSPETQRAALNRATGTYYSHIQQGLCGACYPASFTAYRLSPWVEPAGVVYSFGS